MNIEIWADFVCPFCCIGYARLATAQAGFAHADDVHISYKSFMLSPDEAYEPGQDFYQAFAEAKGLSLDEVQTMFQRVAEMGREAGALIHFDRAKNANTFDAHRIMQYAKEQGLDAAFFARIYQAYFTDGDVISDHHTLQRAAEDVGLDGAAVQEILAGDAYADRVQRDLAEARALGVSSVPLFIFDQKYAISGAQPLDVFRQTLASVWAENAR